MSLPHKLGISLGHKTEISILGSKPRLVCKVSMRAWLAREGPPQTAASVRRARRRADQPRPGTVHGERRGDTTSSREGVGDPKCTWPPPRPPPPNLATAPFTVCALGRADRSWRKDGVTGAVQVPQCSRRLNVAAESGATRTQNGVTCL